MNAAEIRTALDSQYDLSHALHQESARVADAHGQGFTDDPHYLILSAAISGVESAIIALNLLRAASVPSVPAPAAV